MVKTIRPFIALICSFVLALMTMAAYTKKPSLDGSGSYDARGDSEPA